MRLAIEHQVIAAGIDRDFAVGLCLDVDADQVGEAIEGLLLLIGQSDRRVVRVAAGRVGNLCVESGDLVNE